MIWDILEKKITDAGLAVPGVSLFRNSMAANIQVGVMLRSPLAGIRNDPYLPGFYKPNLQAIVRHHDPVAGDLLANQVSKTLKVMGEEDHAATTERGQVKISLFFPRDLPIPYPRLDGNGLEWSINFITAFSMQAL